MIRRRKMKKAAIAGLAASILMTSNADLAAAKEDRGLRVPSLGEISIFDDGGKHEISVGQFIGKWLSSGAGVTVTIKPGGRWESVSADGAYHMKGKWKIEKGALYWKNDKDPDDTDEINMIISLSENRFVLRKPDGSQVEYNRVGDDDQH